MILGRKDAQIYENDQQVKFSNIPAHMGPSKSLSDGPAGQRVPSVWGEPTCLFARMSWPSRWHPAYSHNGPHMDS